MTRNVFYTKTCPVCGITFEASHGRTKYCSLKCRHKELNRLAAVKAAAAKRTCMICGKPLVRKKWKFCSDKCAREGARNLESRKRIKYEYKKPKKHVPTYAEIRAANRAHPIKSGWRGQPRAGGRSFGVFK